MGIYTGVSGVVRQGGAPRVGIGGVVRTVTQGFNGVSGIRRQFFGPLDGLVRVEARISGIYVRSVDSSGNSTETLTGDLATLNQYGSVIASGTQLQVRCNTIGKDLEITGSLYAVFSNGREVQLAHLSDQTGAKYGAEISFPVRYAIYFGHSSSNWSCTGSYRCYCCGIDLNNSAYVNTSVSGTKTQTSFSSSGIDISSALNSGYGGVYQYVNLDFSSGITIDGTNYPVTVVNKLT